MDELQKIIKHLNDDQQRFEDGYMSDKGYARALRKHADALERYIFEHMMSCMS